MGKGSITKESFDDSEVYEGTELEYEHLQLLENSKKLMNQFINDLGPLLNTPIFQWISKHVGKLKTDDLTPQKILKFTDKRIEKMIKNKKIKRNWGDEDSKILAWVVSKFCQSNKIYKLDDMTTLNWSFISSVIPGSFPRDCLFKWLTFKKMKLSDFPWDDDESQILRKLVEQYGEDSWKQVSLSLYEQHKNKKKKYRHPKQCREHWLSFLNPKKKTGLWEKQEDIKLLTSVIEKNGEKKWAEIRKDFQGRTENAMKNRYNLLIEKQRKINEQKDQLKLVYQSLKELGVRNIKKYKKLRSIKLEEQIMESEESEGQQSQMIGQGINQKKNPIPIKEGWPLKPIKTNPRRIITANSDIILNFLKNCSFLQELQPAQMDEQKNIQILRKQEI